MNTAPRCALFDFDGTLADTAPDMVCALNQWLAARGRPSTDAAAARRLCSAGARALLTFAGLGDEDPDAAVSEYLRHYENTGYTRTALFPGIAPLLARLNIVGMPWGVATNKPQQYFAPIAARLLAAHRPAALIARDDQKLPAKPHPATLLAAAAACGVAPAACVYIGDDIRDAAAAQAAAMPFIGVTWGYWREEHWQDSPPPMQARVDTPIDLLAALSGA